MEGVFLVSLMKVGRSVFPPRPLDSEREEVIEDYFLYFALQPLTGGTHYSISLPWLAPLHLYLAIPPHPFLSGGARLSPSPKPIVTHPSQHISTNLSSARAQRQAYRVPLHLSLSPLPSIASCKPLPLLWLGGAGAGRLGADG